MGWSLVIIKLEPLSTEFRWIADVHFLVAEAPHELLCEGREFELYEGNKRVAIGRVLSDSAARDLASSVNGIAAISPR